MCFPFFNTRTIYYFTELKMLKPTILFLLVTLSQSECPRPHDYIESLIISFEQNIVPKIEVLIRNKINIRSVSPIKQVSQPTTCQPDIKSLARAEIMLRRIEHISDIVNESNQYNQSVQIWPIVPLTSDLIRQLKLGLENVESIMRNNFG